MWSDPSEHVKYPFRIWKGGHFSENKITFKQFLQKSLKLNLLDCFALIISDSTININITEETKERFILKTQRRSKKNIILYQLNKLLNKFISI